MLDQRRRRWASIEPMLGERLVFAGMVERRSISSSVQLDTHD